MQDLGYLTKEIRLQVQRDHALLLAERAFDKTRPARFVRGVAVSGSEKNANGDAFHARGLTASLPVPFLIGHEYSEVVGLVSGLDIRGSQVYFTAEIFNALRMQTAHEAWAALTEQRMKCVSAGFRNLDPKPYQQTWASWTIDELSLVEIGADTGAKILRVWEKSRTVSLYRPDETVYWSAP